MQLPFSSQSMINWNAPWLSHLPAQAQQWANSTNLLLALNAATSEVGNLKTGGQQDLKFIPQGDLPKGQSYEAHIFKTGCVPTRLNLHDFFNACIWLTFPRTKAVLNARQAEQIAKHGVQHARGMERDMLTLFDENAAILTTSSPLIANALRTFNWADTLINTRILWDNPLEQRDNAQAALYPFGHALLDKLTTPYKAICAHAWIVLVDNEWFKLPLNQRLNSLDENLAKQLSNIELTTRSFCPLPILGVPHFWADNNNQTFYNDAHVFRNGRTRLTSRPK